VFAPVKTGETSKGNEVSTITAIPTLLEMIALEGCMVTIDAADSSPKDAGIKERIS
jgi:predicted transposase YbfD/YdcC